MLMRACLLLLLVSAVRLPAQTATGTQYLSGTQIRDTVAAAARAESRMAGALLVNRGSYTVLVLRRDRTGEVEVHDAWDDVFVVQEGTATLLHGGQVSGGRQTAPGEWRGGEIAGGTAQVLAPGDVVVFPAGVPHQVQVAPGGSVTYLVIKTQRDPRP